jgi:hypothetical protein
LPSFNIEIVFPQGLAGSLACAAESWATIASPGSAPPSELKRLNDVIDAISFRAGREGLLPLLE